MSCGDECSKTSELTPGDFDIRSGTSDPGVPAPIATTPKTHATRKGGVRRKAAPFSPKVAQAKAVIDDPFGLLGSLDLAVESGAEIKLISLFSSAASPAPSAASPAPSAASPAPSAASPVATAGAVAGEETPESAQVDMREVCGVCGGQMRRGMSNLEYTCLDCGLVVEGDTAEPEDDEAPRPPPNVARLRIVGPNSNLLQPDLYRSGSGSTAATQKKQILEEYKVYRQLYIEAGGRAFPLNALERAAEYYNMVQRQCVKRSQNKKCIMAACLNRGCLDVGFAPAKAEVAAFMQLASKGTARGDNFVRSLVADGKMEINLDVDPSRPEIETLFANLGYEGDQYAGLREAVYNLVQKAIQNNIGTNSILRSKVAGATFAVLRRCKDRTLVPKPMSMQDFCAKRIRKNTVERFLRELDDYHSFFEEVYTAAGLDSAPTRKH